MEPLKIWDIKKFIIQKLLILNKNKNNNNWNFKLLLLVLYFSWKKNIIKYDTIRLFLLLRKFRYFTFISSRNWGKLYYKSFTIFCFHLLFIISQVSNIRSKICLICYNTNYQITIKKQSLVWICHWCKFNS